MQCTDYGVQGLYSLSQHIPSVLATHIIAHTHKERERETITTCIEQGYHFK
jgi:hypothetical protein